MAPLGFVLLTNRGNLTRARLYRSIRHRLGNEPGCDAVRVRPSRARPRSIETRVDPELFLGRACPANEATLHVRFSFPRRVEYEFYVIEWSEAEREFGLGWHQDESHPELGECHVQLDHGGTTVARRSATFLDDHPLNVLETRLEQLRSVLPTIAWSDGTPHLPDDANPTP